MQKKELISMRIISGLVKGRNIKVPNNPTIEPVKEQVRNAIFSIIGDKIKNASCLDLYAGSGSLGLEALSRGAAHCTFVDQDPESEAVIQQNLNNFNLLDQTEVIRDDVLHYVEKSTKQLSIPNDLIFLDPPYVTPTTHLLKQLSSLLREFGLVIYLCGRSKVLPVTTDLEIVTERCYGGTKLVIYKRR